MSHMLPVVGMMGSTFFQNLVIICHPPDWLWNLKATINRHTCSMIASLDNSQNPINDFYRKGSFQVCATYWKNL